MMKRTVTLVLALALFVPAFASGQEDLRATIELAVRSDPNSASLSEVQITALVEALYEDAQRQGITGDDITWRPVPPDSETPACGFSCSVMSAFGLDGSNYIIPAMLGASALLLIFIIGAYLEYRHFRHLHPKHVNASASVSAAPPLQ